MRWALMGAALLALGGLAGCGAERSRPSWLERVVIPNEVREGTPIIAVGDGLRGLTLALRGRQGSVGVRLGSRPDRGMMPAVSATIERPWIQGQVDSGDLPANAIFTRACLAAAPGLETVERCVEIPPTRWRSGPMTGTPPMLVAEVAKRLKIGALVPLEGGDIPLPGEGTATVEVAQRGDDGVIRTSRVGLWPWRSSGPRGTYVLVSPAWLGTRSGPLQLRMRLHRVVAAGEHTTDWSTWQNVVLMPPTLGVDLSRVKSRGPGGPWRRGRPIPGAKLGVQWPTIWRGGPALTLPGVRLVIAGTWRNNGGEVVAVWPKDGASAVTIPVAGRHEPGAVLTSDAWFAAGWAGRVGQNFTGTLAWRLGAAGEVTRTGPAREHTALLGRTIQRVEIVSSTSTRAGLARYGLAAWHAWISARVGAIVAEHFAPWSVEVRLVEGEGGLDEGVERVKVALLDRDPNGFGLLGNDPTVGKDVGNRRLDERLDGRLEAAGRMAGQPPYGGVFLAGFLLFSPQLNPTGLVADPAFDEIFSSWSPGLGGEPMAAPAVGQRQPSVEMAKALEALAQLIAGTVSHEVGHTLGLAAAPGYHHAEDNPGWRMDAGTARPFAERAALPGAGGERWGPLDAAYLTTILPRTTE